MRRLLVLMVLTEVVPSLASPLLVIVSSRIIMLLPSSVSSWGKRSSSRYPQSMELL
jgi:hypothetical protein